MTQRAHANYMQGTATELVVFSGKTDAGREVEMVVGKEMILQIVEGLKISPHLGHAIWHAQNPDAVFPCWSCEQAIKEEHETKERRARHAEIIASLEKEPS